MSANPRPKTIGITEAQIAEAAAIVAGPRGDLPTVFRAVLDDLNILAEDLGIHSDRLNAVRATIAAILFHENAAPRTERAR